MPSQYAPDSQLFRLSMGHKLLNHNRLQLKLKKQIDTALSPINSWLNSTNVQFKEEAILKNLSLLEQILKNKAYFDWIFQLLLEKLAKKLSMHFES